MDVFELETELFLDLSLFKRALIELVEFEGEIDELKEKEDLLMGLFMLFGLFGLLTLFL